jgi:hypothetical protein
MSVFLALFVLQAAAAGQCVNSVVGVSRDRIGYLQRSTPLAAVQVQRIAVQHSKCNNGRSGLAALVQECLINRSARCVAGCCQGLLQADDDALPAFMDARHALMLLCCRIAATGDTT